jgi:hypothetical protein
MVRRRGTSLRGRRVAYARRAVAMSVDVVHATVGLVFLFTCALIGDAFIGQQGRL